MYQYPPNFHVEGDVPTSHFRTDRYRPMNAFADSFHTKKLCSRLYSSKVRFYTEKGRFAFLSLLWEGGGFSVDIRSYSDSAVASGKRSSIITLIGSRLSNEPKMNTYIVHLRLIGKSTSY